MPGAVTTRTGRLESVPRTMGLGHIQYDSYCLAPLMYQYRYYSEVCNTTIYHPADRYNLSDWTASCVFDLQKGQYESFYRKLALSWDYFPFPYRFLFITLWILLPLLMLGQASLLTALRRLRRQGSPVSGLQVALLVSTKTPKSI